MDRFSTHSAQSFDQRLSAPAWVPVLTKRMTAGGPVMIACFMLFLSVVAETFWFIREAYFPY